ncbi:metallophosphoesterase [Caballeronia sp. LP006]|uniref:metallophosphoesterase n=1 Tax=unclassified Caballeronia TaxID=2646786 RepID=UPI002027D890|nr:MULTISPECIES: metallophosphoesterase [unclassified Caballeronia]MDR5800496.1 metallophosphoesterase [Caballeronia sp. LZ001]MDR5830958.1 metallophosphoesterase [Caballeronia sp. LP006]
MKIRVLSDLHLENDEPLAIPYAEADLVVLAGDIHNHAEGVRWAVENFGSDVPIVYVPGNHEYYDAEFGAMEAAMLDAAQSVDNVHYLNNAALVDRRGAWRVLGTTLWTDFALFGSSDEEIGRAQEACIKVMLDYRGLIQLAWPEQDGEPRAFAPEDSLALHEQARAWLENELARPFAGQTIVVTHHAPLRESLSERYATDIVSAGFVNHLPTLARTPAALWIHGHTHTSFDYTANGTRVVCNPRGYFDRRSGRWENEQFAWDKVVEI